MSHTISCRLVSHHILSHIEPCISHHITSYHTSYPYRLPLIVVTQCPRLTYPSLPPSNIGNRNSSQCMGCPGGFWCPNFGMSAPQHCPGGFICNATSFFVCPAGYQCPMGRDGNRFASACLPGTFQNEMNSTACIQCPKGETRLAISTRSTILARLTISTRLFKTHSYASSNTSFNKPSHILSNTPSHHPPSAPRLHVSRSRRHCHDHLPPAALLPTLHRSAPLLQKRNLRNRAR